MFKMRPLNLLTGVILYHRTVLATQVIPQNPIITTTQSTSDLLALHKSLVEYSSITYHEQSATHFLTSYLKQQNFTVETQLVTSATEIQHARHNLLAYIGTTRETHTLVTSHIDTVPPYWPYQRREQDEIWGRGTVDAKGSVAAQIHAVLALLQAGAISEGDVALLFVVGEETGGDGMRAANNLGLEWKVVIFGEPTELKLASGHKGNVGVRIAAHGKAGHSGYPELGRNANRMLVKALYALDELPLPWSEKYGNTTLNIGRMEGGVAGNVIAEEAEALLQIRIAAGEPANVEKLILRALQDLEEELDIRFTPGYGPIEIDHDIEGFETIVVNYGTDIPNLKGRHKKYLYGPGDILVAHSDHEHLKISDLEIAVEGYKTLIKASLK